MSNGRIGAVAGLRHQRKPVLASLRLIAEAGPSVLYPPRAAWHFLAQTNSQAIALTNAMPQIERLWELPKVGGYLDRFAKRTQEIGHILKDS